MGDGEVNTPVNLLSLPFPGEGTGLIVCASVWYKRSGDALIFSSGFLHHKISRLLAAIDVMTLTYIWAGFFIVGFLAALVQWLFMGDVEVFKRIVDGTFESARVGVMEISLPLAGVMTLWLGILTIGEKAGAIQFVAQTVIAPFFSRIFPRCIPKDHPATGLMVMNYSANFLGLDNAATPVGLKAMESLQTPESRRKDEATDAQIMFLVLQTAGLTLIPLTVMAQRAVLGAKDPSDIFIPTLDRHVRRHLGGVDCRCDQAAHQSV